MVSVTGYSRERYANPRPNRTEFSLESIRTISSVNVKVTNRQYPAIVFHDYDRVTFLSDATDLLRPGVYRYKEATSVTSFHGYDRVLLIQCINICH